MLPSAYTKAVLACYQQKSRESNIPLGTRHLTRRGLRAACVEICRDRYDRKDAPLLRAFFEGGDNQAAFLQAITHHPVDKFRPLVSFLKEETTNPEDKVVELAAWLIDFKPRPYHPSVDYTKTSGNCSESSNAQLIKIPVKTSPAELGERDNRGHLAASDSEKSGKKKKKIILAITITVVFGMIILWLWPNKPPVPVYIGHQACMFWNEDHYQTISCRQHGDTLVVALDSGKLTHFRKITQPGTITTNAIGSVWYVRYRGTYEFYTADGFHPIDLNLRLRPITEFIITHHIPAHQ
jgi:hypothetical protein